MTARLVMLVLATASLAACATATTDVSAYRAGPTKGEYGSRRVIKGPVVPDKPAATRLAATRPAATRSAAARHTPVQQQHATPRRARTTQPAVAAIPAPSRYVTREVPNPLRPAPPAQATTPAPELSGLPTEPVQPASIEQSWAQPELPATTTADVPIQEQQAEPAASSGTWLPNLGNITIDSIEQTFGGMPFWLISVIAAALVATFGIALRRKRDRDDHDYEEPRVEDPEEDYREPYAA